MGSIGANAANKLTDETRSRLLGLAAKYYVFRTLIKSGDHGVDNANQFKRTLSNSLIFCRPMDTLGQDSVHNALSVDEAVRYFSFYDSVLDKGIGIEINNEAAVSGWPALMRFYSEVFARIKHLNRPISFLQASVASYKKEHIPLLEPLIRLHVQYPNLVYFNFHEYAVQSVKHTLDAGLEYLGRHEWVLDWAASKHLLINSDKLLIGEFGFDIEGFYKDVVGSEGFAEAIPVLYNARYKKRNTKVAVFTAGTDDDPKWDRTDIKEDKVVLESIRKFNMTDQVSSPTQDVKYAIIWMTGDLAVNIRTEPRVAKATLALAEDGSPLKFYPGVKYKVHILDHYLEPMQDETSRLWFKFESPSFEKGPYWAATKWLDSEEITEENYNKPVPPTDDERIEARFLALETQMLAMIQSVTDLEQDYKVIDQDVTELRQDVDWLQDGDIESTKREVAELRNALRDVKTSLRNI